MCVSASLMTLDPVWPNDGAVIEPCVIGEWEDSYALQTLCWYIAACTWQVTLAPSEHHYASSREELEQVRSSRPDMVEHEIRSAC